MSYSAVEEAPELLQQQLSKAAVKQLLSLSNAAVQQQLSKAAAKQQLSPVPVYAAVKSALLQ